MNPEVLRESAHRRMRWKNGQGETAEIAVDPPGAALDAFAWRVSMARVDADGPFSAFAAIDRTLTLLAGAGMRLMAAGREPVILDVGTAPYSFPGDVACEATLVAGGIVDLNVMTRRGVAWHRVRRLDAGPGTVAADVGDALFVNGDSGAARLVVAGREIELARYDAVRVGPGPHAFELAAAVPGRVLLIEIGRCAPGA
jgi:hypothetical protein